MWCKNISLKNNSFISLIMASKYLLGFDVGSSSVKASLVNADSGKCVASAFYPEKEAPIMAVKAGWAEQDPQMWWDNAKLVLKKIMADASASAEEIKAIGISYQMHGLVCVDKSLKALRPSIIWCDSRAVPYGEKAFKDLGAEKCLSHLLNSPGNFTAAKLAWVKENEPEVYEKIYKIMLPGDYIAMRLSGVANTTVSGLSEGMFWDFKNNKVADFLMDYYGFDSSLISDIVPTFSVQSEVCAEAAAEMGLKEGTPITISYIGYLTQELKATQGMRVTLREDAQTLQDVVVIGYGVQKNLPVNRAHIFLNGQIVKNGGAELVNAVSEHGYAPFEVES